MAPFAITLSDLIEKGGAYAGIAAFFGFAVLAVLHFANARELKRLREWAGRAPERAQELEARVMQQAEEARRVRAQPQQETVARPATPAGAAAATAAGQNAVAPATATAATAATAAGGAAPAQGQAAPPPATPPAPEGAPAP